MTTEESANDDMTEYSVQCGGQCCRGFYMITSTAKHRAEKYAEIIAWRDSGEELEPWMDEYIVIHEMLIEVKSGDESGESMYTCKHLSTEGLCGIYETRPGMCRRFPYGRACMYCGFIPESKSP